MAYVSFRKVTNGVQSLDVTIGPYSASAVISVNEAIPGSATTQIFQAIDVSAVVAFTILATVACTLKTNSSGSPDNTIVLRANEPYTWHTNSYDASKLTVDVVSLFIVVAGATAGTLQIEGAQDATP